MKRQKKYNSQHFEQLGLILLGVKIYYKTYYKACIEDSTVLEKGWPQRTIEQNRFQNRPFEMFPVDLIADVQTIQWKNGKRTRTI